MRESWSKEKLVEGGGESPQEEEVPLEPVQLNQALSAEEKKFLLLAERGDVASVRRLLEQHQDRTDLLDINCVDPLNRSALIAAIENENIELIRILLEYKIKVKDSLLHAIKEEYVEAVELLLEFEEKNHVAGQPYSWEAVDRHNSNFTPDITPLILAAHMNNYEILKILLDRGASVPVPHDIRCGCDECVVSREHDSLRHSQSRINAYRALAAPSLIALSSNDPLLTAFHLSWELRRMSRMETEFRNDYNELRAQCQTFATSLLDHVRTSSELETMLNYDPNATQFEIWQPGERQTLQRLKLAINYKQKKFVAHPNVQQLLAAIWYEGLPGFRRKGPIQQVLEVAKLGCMFPIYTAIYMLAPKSNWGKFMTKPFVKFICHSASYGLFLMLLGLASQRVETLLMEWFGNEWMRELVNEWKRKERGSLPGLVESVIFIYIISLIWNEARALWEDGILAYISDLWNIVDFITNMFYCCWIFMRISAWYIVQRETYYGLDPYYPRENWDMLDPMLISEGAFAAGMIFSFLKLVHIFSVNPHLGPLQISLGRMIIDILKFFFIYTLVLFAFGCGLNQLMWYYAELEKAKCYVKDGDIADFIDNEMSCSIWRRFSNLFETSQTLFWAGFGLVDLINFELTGIKGFTRFWGLLVFGSYSVINIIVLLNMLIAMMSNSYQIISERSDMEWKFARSKLWMSYFDDSETIPPPFNLLPTVNMLSCFFECCDKSLKPTPSMLERARQKSRVRHDNVMKLLVRRYVMAEQRKRDEVGITEDDIMEIRQDISTLRFELIDILANNGMKTPKINTQDSNVPGKKGKVMERRLLKDFQIGLVEGAVIEAIQSDKTTADVFSKIARAIGKRASSKKKSKDWNALVRKGTIASNPIGSTSEAQAKRVSRQSIRKYIIENQNKIATLDPEKLLQYNPKLSTVTPATRVAYAKFKISKIKSEYENRQVCASETSSVCESSTDIRATCLDENRIMDNSGTTVVEISREDIGDYDVPSDTVEPEQEQHQDEQEPEIQNPGYGFRPKTPIMEDPREDMQTPSIDDGVPGSPFRISGTDTPKRSSLSPAHMPQSIIKPAPEQEKPPSPPIEPTPGLENSPSSPSKPPEPEKPKSITRKPSPEPVKPRPSPSKFAPKPAGGNWL